MTVTKKIQFGDNLLVTDIAPGTIRVDASGGSGGGGTGIEMDSTDNTGAFLQIDADESIRLFAVGTIDGSISGEATGDINFYAGDADSSTGNDFIATAHRLMTLEAGNAIQLHPGGIGGDLEIRLVDTWAMTVAKAGSAAPLFIVNADGTVEIPLLPTVDPARTGAIWNDGGTVVFSGSTAGGGGGGGVGWEDV